MHKRNWFGAAVLGLTIAVGLTHPLAQTIQSTIEEIRSELIQMPYNGVFDFLAFKYDRGEVTLVGYAYQPSLKGDAVRAVKRASGVDQVIDKIEQLPSSAIDDDIRWKAYYAIYRDPFLSRYAPGGALLWGHRHSFGSGLHPLGSGPFAGLEPAGDYPIHIVVKGGEISLLGVVDNATDKNLAGMKARGVQGTFGVDNQLMVENPDSRRT